MNKIFFLLCLCFKLQAQDTIVFPKIDLYKRNIIEISYEMPLGTLSNKYQNAIKSGVYFRTKLFAKQYLDVGIEIGVISKSQAINYEYNNEIVYVKGAKTSLLVGLRYTKFLYQTSNQNFHIESNSGLGWKTMLYYKPDDQKYESTNFNPQLHTIAFSQGFKIMYRGYGIHCNYQFAPYTMFEKSITRDFGHSSFSIGFFGSWRFD